MEPSAQAVRVASRFAMPSLLSGHDFAGKGNIHLRAFLIESLGTNPPERFLLQQINEQVFTRPRAVMAAMLACIEAQQANIRRGRLQPGEEWEPITLVPTREGAPYLDLADGADRGCWRLMRWIEGTRTFKSLGEIADARARLFTAEQAGAGLALYGTLTDGMDTTGLSAPLPGYRDTRLYYDQLLSVLAGHRTLAEAARFLPKDTEVRQATERHFLVHLPEAEYQRRMVDTEVRGFVNLIRGSEDLALMLLRGMETGRIRRGAIHGDTKLENFLFDATTGKVKALVDLDTIMPHTWLADWGDMVRSLVNVAGEKEADLRKVQVDREVYRAVARGFLRSARSVTAAELDLMVEGVQVIALELGMRFLTDYLRGDTYFGRDETDAADLNRVRGLAQLTLFTRLRESAAETRAMIDALRSELGAAGPAGAGR